MRGFAVKSLGEVAIRCANVAEMLVFYRDVIGLPVLSGSMNSDTVFLEIGPGHGGHTCVLALFSRDAGRPKLHARGVAAPVTGGGSSLHHIALGVDYEAQDAAVDRFRQHGLDPRMQVFDWIGWRGVFVADPEGNTVELVERDPDWTAPRAVSP